MNIGNIVYSRNTSTATKLACDKYHSIKRDDFCLFRFFPVGRSKKFFDWLTNRCVVLLPPLFCLSCLFYTWMATFVTMYGTMKISIYMWFRSIVVSHYSRYTYYVFYFASLREKNTKQEITDKWDMVAN